MILSQAIIIAYAVASALQEIPVIRMARDYVPVGNPYSQPFHLWGWVMTVIVANILAIMQPSICDALISFLLSSLWYWLLFDAIVSKQVHDTLFYIGNTAKLDKLQRKYLGKYAGQIKAWVCLLLIIGLNILYYKSL